MTDPVLIATLAGLPCMIYGVTTMIKFSAFSQQIAAVQRRSNDLLEPGGEGGMNNYQIELFEQLINGDELRGIDEELSEKARHIGKHLRWSTRMNIAWIVVVGTTYWITVS